MPLMNHGTLASPSEQIEELMASPRPLLRIQLELRAGSLLPVLERLQIAGQSPRLMIFRKEADGSGRLILDFTMVNEPTSEALVSWLEQLLGVNSVATEWRPVPEVSQ
jgi:hypothetical protein